MLIYTGEISKLDGIIGFAKHKCANCYNYYWYFQFAESLFCLNLFTTLSMLDKFRYYNV